MPQDIKICYHNILETAANVIVTSENVLFPAYRLYDRDIGKLFVGDSNPANFYITVVQVSQNQYEVDRLIIPAGHNLDGLVIKLQYSNDNFVTETYDALSWTQSGSGLIDKPFTPPAEVQCYWRLNIAAPASAPELAEMFLTKEYEFECAPEYGLGEGDEKNEIMMDSQSGIEFGVKQGEVRRYRTYSLKKMSTAQKAEIEAWDKMCGMIKGIYIEDHNGDVFFARLLTQKLLFHLENVNRYACDIEVREKLA